ncbi:FIG00929846: hypothetical protein [hydrothermal vent metagenome]|uniref:SSD domain-containing protein n=1 Tax=hydrothermal vent metagenome TaxID=652676 RepID=A0A3B1DA28_9ZZZZ
MKNFFEKRDPWGNSYSLWTIAIMIFMTPLAWWSISHVHLQDDITDWLPKNDSRSEILSWYKNEFRVEDQILVSWEGSSLGDPRVEKLAQKIRGISDAQGIRRGGILEIETVVTPDELLNTITKHHVSREEALRRLEGVLVGRGTLKVELTKSGKVRKERVLRQITEQARNQLGISLTAGPSSAEMADATSEEYDEDFEGDELEEEEIVEEDETTARPFEMQLFWSGMHSHPQQVEQVQELLANLSGRPTQQHPAGEKLVAGTFFEIGSPVALAMSLSQAGKEDEQLAFSKIKEAAIAVGIDAKSLRLGGRPVAATELNNQISQVIWNPQAPFWMLHRRSPVLLSAIVSLLLAFVMLRSFRLTTIVLITTFYATFAAVAFVPLTGGSMNMVLVVMPTLLMVLTLSASIHIANYWKQTSPHHPKKSISHAVKMATPPCVLAAITTAVGMLSLTTSSLTPVRSFGIYTAVGCLISLVVVLYGMPALLQVWSSKEVPSDTNSSNKQATWELLGYGISRAWVPITFACLLLFAVSACGLSRFKTESKIVRYFPDNSRIVQDYRFLEENLSGIVPVDLVIRFDKESQETTTFLSRMEVIRNIQEKIRQHPDISGTLSLADFQPVMTLPSEKAKQLSKMRFARKSNIIEKRIKKGKNRAESRSFLTVAQKKKMLQKARGESFSIEEGDELWRITAQVSLLSDVDYVSLCGDKKQQGDLNEIACSVLKYQAGANHVITGTVPLFLQTQQAVLSSLIRSTAIAFAVIAIIMMVILKNPTAGLLTMLPNLMPVGVVLGLISWNGLSIDIGTMITAAVALGIAVDGTLHLLTWFKSGIKEGFSRQKSIAQALAHCGPVLVQTSLIISVGLLTLYPSELLLIQRFSWMMACMIASALVADIIFLPALLAGPLGSMIESTIQKQASSSIQRTDDPAQEMLEEIAARSPDKEYKPHLLKLPLHNERKAVR